MGRRASRYPGVQGDQVIWRDQHPSGLTDPEAILQTRMAAQARRELGNESPPSATLRRLDCGHHDSVQARTKERLEKLRELYMEGLSWCPEIRRLAVVQPANRGRDLFYWV
jgi:hypothetical protein